MTRIEEQAIAIAAILQCCRLVRELAYEGRIEHEHLVAANIHSLFNFDPKDTLDTFGGDIHNLNLGLETFQTLLSGGERQESDTEIIRYAVNLIGVTKAFMSDGDMMRAVHARLEALKPAYLEHGVDDALMTDLNLLYRETISQLPVRIVINGEKRFLEEPRIASHIRSLLLAGVRATVLWRQLGGTRWALVLRRGQYLKVVRKLSLGHE